MPRAKKEPERCKKIAATTGKRCQRKAKDNGYCPQHQPPPSRPFGNRNSETHGLYSQSTTAEEQELIAGLDLKDISGELLSMKIQYLRCLRIVRLLDNIEPTPEERARLDGLMQIYEERTEGGRVDVALGDGQVEEGDPIVVKTSTTRRMPDFNAILDRFAGRIESLTKMLLQLDEHGKLQEMLDQMKGDIEHLSSQEDAARE